MDGEHPTASIPSDAVHLASGLSCQVLRPGRDTERPGPNDVVRASFRVWTDTGRPVEETSTAITFLVAGLGPGPAEALQLIGTGGRVRAWVPLHLAATSVVAAPEEDRTRIYRIYQIDLAEVIRVEEPTAVPKELRSPTRE
jgi:hypothetical protein